MRSFFAQLKDTQKPLLGLLLSFSLLTSTLYFFDAFTALSLWPLLAFYLCTVGLGKHWSLSLCRLLVLIFFFLAVWSFRVEGVVFGDGFFVHAQLNTLMFMGFYPDHTTATLSAFVLFALIESFVIHQRVLWYDGLKPLLVLSILMMSLLGLSPVPTFLTSLGQSKSHSEPLPSLDKAQRTLTEKKIEVQNLFPTLPQAHMDPKHNVLMLYLESLEARYLDEKRFPNLMPFLNQLRSESTSFSHFNQNKNVFTISGLFASQCGYPFEVLTSNKDINKTLFYQGTHHLTCLSDVFAQLGFTQVFMQGTSLDFAGTRYFLESHQYNEIIGAQQLTGSSKAYAIFRDKPLYAHILKKVRQLSAASQPFHISSINFDTHDPGHTDRHCKPYGNGKDNVLNAVHCFDGILKEFFERMSAEGLMKGLRVAILSDHLSMTRFKEEPGRKNLLLLYDPQKPQGKTISQTIYHHDVPHIFFDFLGITQTPSYPLAYSPLSQKARAHPQDEVLLNSLSRIFKEQQKETLPCNTQVSFNFNKNLFIFNQKKVFFSPGHGVLTWPKDRIALMGVDAKDRILFKELVYADEVTLKLSNPQVHRVLLWGYLQQLEAFAHAPHNYGYFWGRLDQPKHIQPLNLEHTQRVTLKCQPL